MLSARGLQRAAKTLEEPPPRVKFIFATTEYHKMPATILSRCQQFDFRLIPARELAAHLRTSRPPRRSRSSRRGARLIARAAEGSVRDALSLFDQVLAFSGDRGEGRGRARGCSGSSTASSCTAPRARSSRATASAMLELVESLADYGADYRNFLRELLLHLREILLVKLAPAGSRSSRASCRRKPRRCAPLAETLLAGGAAARPRPPERGGDRVPRTSPTRAWRSTSRC